MRAHRIRVCIEGTDEPLTVPASGLDGLDHRGDFLIDGGSLLTKTDMTADICIFLSVLYEHAGDEDRFRDRTLGWTGGLEALTRLLGEAVQVQTVVPVGATDQRQLVRSLMRDGEMEAPTEMLHERLRIREIRIPGTGFIENREVTGLREIGMCAGNQPERIIVETATDVSIALLGQRLVLMIAGAIRKLCVRDVEDAFACAGRNQMDEPEQVLTAVTEAHATAHAALEVGGGAGHVEGHHALILIPDIHDAVQLLVAAVYRIAAEETIPVGLQLCERSVHLRVRLILREKLLRRLLIDDARRFPLLVDRILTVAEHEDEALGCARCELNLQMMRADRLPAMGDGVATLAGEHCLRIMEAVVDTDEGVTACVEADDRSVDGKYRIVIPTLAILCLMVDRAADHLDLARREVPLEVRLIVLRVPETELDEAEEVNASGRHTIISQGDAVDLTGVVHRHEGLELRLELILPACDDGIAETVTTLIRIKRSLRRLPARIPDAVAILDIVVAATLVERTVVVTVAGETQEFRILIEGVASCRVRDETEEVPGPEVVDPWERGLRSRDDIFSLCVIEMTEFHKASFYIILKTQKIESEINKFTNTFSLHIIIFSWTKVVNRAGEKINEMYISYKNAFKYL